MPRPLTAGTGEINRARRWGLLFFFVFLVITLIIFLVVFLFFAFFGGGFTGFAADGEPRSQAQVIDDQLGELKEKITS